MADGDDPAQWRPYEGAGLFRRGVACREFVLAPFKRRYFFLPGINPQGVAVGEILILVALCGVLIVVGVMQRNDSLGSGVTASVVLAATPALASRKLNIAACLFGMPYERAIRWHFMMSVAAVGFGVVHACVTMTALGWRWSTAVGDGDGVHDHSTHDHGPQNLRGSLVMGSMVLLLVSSARPIRRLLYQQWKYSHMILSVACLVFSVLHKAYIGAAGFGLLILDRLLTDVVQALVLNRHISVNATVAALPADVVHISFPRKNFNYKAGQYVMLCVPRLSLFEWHPFSISSAPDDEEVSVHVRARGDWTARLQVVATYHSLADKKLWVFVHGPYGQLSVDIEGPTYSMFLLISGGIGITPMQSVMRSLLQQAARKSRSLRKVMFVWTVRDRFLLDAVYDKELSRRLPKDLPVSFQPDNVSDAMKQAQEALLRLRDPEQPHGESVFETEFYLTKARSEERHREANIEPSRTPQLRMKRPDVESILQRIAAMAREAGETKVAVLVCCPGPFARSICDAAAALTTSGVVRFDVHVELFKW